MEKPREKQFVEKDLHTIYGDLLSVATKWYDLGLALGLLSGELDEILQRSFTSGARECLREMLKLWLLKSSLKSTPKALIDALRERTVDLIHLADELEIKYGSKKQQEPDSQSADSVDSGETIESKATGSKSHSRKKKELSDCSSSSSTGNNLPVKRPSASNEKPDPKRQKTAVTIKELLLNAGITKEDMEMMCSQDDLLALSKFCDPWDLVGKHLKLNSLQINAVDGDNKSVDQKRLGMLQKWKEAFAHKATYGVLVNALIACEKVEQALEVCKMLARQNNAETGSQQSQIHQNNGVQTRQRSAKSQPPKNSMDGHSATSSVTSDGHQKKSRKLRPAPSSLKAVSQPVCGNSTPKVVTEESTTSIPLRYNQMMYQFIKPPPKELLCQKCHQLAYEPHQLKCCNKLYCKLCLPSGQCCLCRCKGIESFSDGISNDRIRDLPIKCPNSSNGCSWEGNLGIVMDHRSDCEKETIPCLYKDTGCKEVMLRERLEQHKEEKCLVHLDSSLDVIVKLQETVVTQSHEIKTLQVAAEKSERRIQSLIQAISCTPPIAVIMTPYKVHTAGYRIYRRDDDIVWISSKFCQRGYNFYLILRHNGNPYRYCAETKVGLTGEYLDEESEPEIPTNLRGKADVTIEGCNFILDFVIYRVKSKCLKFHEIQQQKQFDGSCLSSVSWLTVPRTADHQELIKTASNTDNEDIQYIYAFINSINLTL